MEQNLVFHKQDSLQEGIGEVYCTIKQEAVTGFLLILLFICGSFYVLYKLIRGDSFVINGTQNILIPVPVILGIVVACLAVACVIGRLMLKGGKGITVGAYGIEIDEKQYPYSQLEKITIKKSSFVDIAVLFTDGNKITYTWLHFPKKYGQVLNQINDFLRIQEGEN